MGICCIRKETNLVSWSSKKINHAITENFGIGADSLDDSDLEDNDEDKQDDFKDQNAAIIGLLGSSYIESYC